MCEWNIKFHKIKFYRLLRHKNYIYHFYTDTLSIIPLMLKQIALFNFNEFMSVFLEGKYDFHLSVSMQLSGIKCHCVQFS